MDIDFSFIDEAGDDLDQRLADLGREHELAELDHEETRKYLQTQFKIMEAIELEELVEGMFDMGFYSASLKRALDELVTEGLIRYDEDDESYEWVGSKGGKFELIFDVLK